ncbi:MULTISPECIES: hypothetical protein [Enterobacteriaceae]|uniref:hypothetical protein n=1 Tax=Enterobacteriaceae TaxID=543 RepID=UPI0005AA3343|nr:MULTISPECIES: hypothetical protein [Enterobacteriaceae]EKZ5680407.1 hypothetical protein [Klebsiella quasipneumoniae]HDS9648234.1 hypothetical protein [Klebsiella pneumoniae subsp. pneumoniae]EFK7984496.1 hypothetical protein [Escherichia coli]EFK8066307.1 hypothetical protein [Escherichia coli]ELD1739172.1 hypothetical protein [Escherichia coli]
MRIVIVIVTFLWLCCGLFYSYQVNEMKAYSIAATGFIAFLTALANYFAKKSNSNSQTQKVKSKSIGIQVGGDFNFNSKKDDN